MHLLLSLALLLADAPTADDEPPPHIVLFVADDLGWNGVGYHGGPVRTPHIDSLAESGARLEQFYVQPLCSPSRAALMTGRYPIRLGLQRGVIRPWADFGLDLGERLLSEVLRDAGYETAIAGKWHLGLVTPEYLPLQRGFEHQYGCYTGSIDYLTHERMGGSDWHRDDQPVTERGYVTDLIARECVRLIEERDPERPLFLYVPFTAPHEPLMVPPRLRGDYRELENKNFRAYASMVSAMDDAIGKVLGALDHQGMREHTLVLFISDNGGPAGEKNGPLNDPLRSGKGSTYEGSVRVPAVVSWPGHVPSAIVDEPLHIVDLMPTLARVAGASLEGTRTLDGLDAWDTISADAPSPRDVVLMNALMGNGAVRKGDHKLVRTGHGDEALTELFDLSRDPGETKNLAEELPEKTRELTELLLSFDAESLEPLTTSEDEPPDFRVPRCWGHPERGLLPRKRAGR